MTGNFEFALAQVRPGYVVSIGDDDGFMPNAINQVADLISQTGFSAITSSSIYYAWPNFPIEELRNKLVVRDVRQGVKTVNARDEATQRIRCQGEERYYVWGLPSVYRGFISTEIIERARKQGSYFHSVTPDAYSAFVNSFFIDTYAYSRYPYTIEGVSGKSNGASQLIGRDASEEQKYLTENDIPFIDQLVYAPSAPIIMAEAFLQASRQFPECSKGYDLDIQMICKAAQINTRGGNVARVNEAVDQILRMHGKKGKSESLRALLYRTSHTFLDAILSVEIDCERHGVKDVYEASLLAQRTLHEGRCWHQGLQVLGKKAIKKLRGGAAT